MILGNITGKVSTTEFNFLVRGNAQKFQYIQILHKDNDYILAQITEIIKDSEKTIAHCSIIGYREDSKLLRLKTPLEPGTEVLRAEDDFVKKTLGLEEERGAYMGILEGREKIKTYLNVNKLLTRHVSILAKTGSGKSYATSVLLEELLEKNIPLLIIDPHGEYSSLKYPNPDKENMEKFDVSPKGFLQNIQEYSPDIKINTEAKPLKLSNKNLSSSELIHLLPAKLSQSQLSLLYSSLRNLGDRLDFNEVILALENEESSIKWTIINTLEYLKKLELFSDSPTRPLELIKPGTASIINLKGINQEVQEVVVYKLVRDLFEERKKGNIPPFFLVVEEAHNFCPERSFGEAKSSHILRQVASEGRKFGLGLAVITQRPARVDKNILSQCGTQIILKVTNPNDIKAISNSVEGLTLETEREIQNIPVGTALITGLVDLPLFVDIRTRKTKHGGEAIKILREEEIDIEKEIDEVKELLPLIQQKISKKDLALMNEEKVIKTLLTPCLLLNCKQNNEDFNLLVNLFNNQIVINIETGEGIPLNITEFKLSKQQNKILRLALNLQEFKTAELFSKSGVQFSELYDVVSTLAEKGVFIKIGDSYKVNNEIKRFSNLKESACYEKSDFADIDYDDKLNAKVNPNEVIDLLNNFVDVVSEKETYLVSYQLSL